MQQLSYDGANPSPKTSLLSKSHGGHNHRSSTFAGLSLRLLHTTCPLKTFVCLTIRNAQINNNICGRQSRWWRSSRALYFIMEFTHYIGLTFKFSFISRIAQHLIELSSHKEYGRKYLSGISYGLPISSIEFTLRAFLCEASKATRGALPAYIACLGGINWGQLCS